MFLSNIILDLLKKNSSNASECQTEIVAVIAAYIQFHTHEKTINTPEIQNELNTLRQDLLRYAEQYPSVNVSSALSLFNSSDNLNNNQITPSNSNAENTDELLKSAYICVFFGFKGFNCLNFEKIIHNRNKLKTLIDLIKAKKRALFIVEPPILENKQPNPNFKTKNQAIDEIMTFLNTSSAAIHNKGLLVLENQKENIKIQNCNEISPLNHQEFEGAAWMLFALCPQLSSATRIVFLEAIIAKARHKTQILHDSLIIASQHKDKESVTYLITQKKLNPFETSQRNSSAFYYAGAIEMRRHMVACLNGNLLDYIKNIKLSEETHFALLLFIVDSNDTALFQHLVNYKNGWEGYSFDFDDYYLFPKPTINLQASPTDNPEFVQTYTVSSRIKLNTLSQVAILNKAEFAKIIFQSSKKYCTGDIIDAIDLALMYNSMDVLPILIKHLPINQFSIENQKKFVGLYEHILIKAVIRQIEPALFKSLIEKLTPALSITDDVYAFVSETGIQAEHLKLLIQYTRSFKKYATHFWFACTRLARVDYQALSLINKQLQLMFGDNTKLPSIDFNEEYESEIHNFLLYRLAQTVSYYNSISALYMNSYSSVLQATKSPQNIKPEALFSFSIPKYENDEMEKFKQESEVFLKNLKAIILLTLSLPCKFKLNSDGILQSMLWTDGKKEMLETTAFTMASIIGDPDIVVKMLEKGAQIEAANFCLAALHGHTDCLTLLLERGADHYFYQSKEGKTAIEYAVINNHKACVELLINHLLQNDAYAKDDNVIKLIKKAYKLCTLEQTEIRDFLFKSLGDIEKQKLEAKNPHRITIQEDAQNTNNNNQEQNDNSIKRYHRVTFFNPELQKKAVAFISNKHWNQLHKGNRDHFEKTLTFFGSNQQAFGKRLFSVRNPETGEHDLKFRSYLDERAFLRPLSKEDLQQKYQQESIDDDTVYYKSTLKPSHSSRRVK